MVIRQYFIFISSFIHKIQFPLDMTEYYRFTQPKSRAFLYNTLKWVFWKFLCRKLAAGLDFAIF